MEVAASIIGIAAAGAKVATALTKFSISYLGADKKLEQVAARASLSATILYAIGETVKENESLFKSTEFLSTWSDVLGAASSSFKRLEAGLEKARGPGKRKLGMGVWKKFEWGLGGEDRARDLDEALEKCCSQVMMMQQVIQWKVLQRIVPTDKEVQEKEELKEKLDWIVKMLLKSGLISPQKPIHTGKVDSAVPYRQDRGNIDASSAGSPTPASSMASEEFIVNTAGTSTTLTPNTSIEIGSQLFEAYYFIPDIFENDQYHGAIRVAQAKPNNYIAVYVDIEHNLSSQMLVSNAKLRHHQSKQATMRRLRHAPKAAQNEIENFAKSRTETSNGTMWAISDFQEFDFVCDGRAHGDASRTDDVLSAFLVVFRARNVPLSTSRPASPSTLVATESRTHAAKLRSLEMQHKLMLASKEHHRSSSRSRSPGPPSVTVNNKIYDSVGSDPGISLTKEEYEKQRQYRLRTERDLRNSGLDEKQIAGVLKEKGPDNPPENRPVYTKLSRRHLSIETLNQRRIDYELDEDPNYILIKRWVPDYEQEFLWKHTSNLREARRSRQPPHAVVYDVEGRNSHQSEVEVEYVRKPEGRKLSPSSISKFGSESRNYEPRREHDVSMSHDVEDRNRISYSVGQKPKEKSDDIQRLKMKWSLRRPNESKHKRDEVVEKRRGYEKESDEEEAEISRLKNQMLKEREREQMLKREEEKVTFRARGRRHERGKDEEPALSERQAEHILNQFLATFSA